MRVRAAAAIALLTFLSGCGQAPVPTGNIVTPQERYSRQADTLCRHYRDAALGASLAYKDASTKERANIRRRLATKAEKTQKKLEALPRPKTRDQKLLNPLFKKMRQQIDSLRAGKQVPDRGLAKLSRRYGFDVCGEGGAL